MMAAICQFPSVEGAVQSTVEVLQNGIDIARMGRFRYVITSAIINYTIINNPH